MQHRLKFTILLLALAFLTACSSNSTEPTENDASQLSGTSYQAVAIMGEPLPFVVTILESEDCDDHLGHWDYGDRTAVIKSFTYTFKKDNRYELVQKATSICTYPDGHTDEENVEIAFTDNYWIEGSTLKPPRPEGRGFLSQFIAPLS